MNILNKKGKGYYIIYVTMNIVSKFIRIYSLVISSHKEIMRKYQVLMPMSK